MLNLEPCIYIFYFIGLTQLVDVFWREQIYNILMVRYLKWDMASCVSPNTNIQFVFCGGKW